jgi:hypothetical protein
LFFTIINIKISEFADFPTSFHISNQSHISLFVFQSYFQSVSHQSLCLPIHSKLLFFLFSLFSGPSIFAIEPHDILPLSIFAFNDCLGGIKGHKCLGCVTSLCFYVPLMKHVYSWVCARSADRKNLLSMLDRCLSLTTHIDRDRDREIPCTHTHAIVPRTHSTPYTTSMLHHHRTLKSRIRIMYMCIFNVRTGGAVPFCVRGACRRSL